VNAVEVVDVSKRFTLRRENRPALQDTALDFLHRRSFGRSSPSEDFWALRDMSFDVPHGETFGIIGANGSGKSTLLKLMARTMRPTHGSVRVDGRVAGLLELGAGFHPDLTGRENVFLNGSFLGLSQAFLESRFDQIVDFAGIEQFIDVPVKHYSSGMYVRLAFAVAINVDAEILLIDEVLAVGDETFQRKCMDRLVSLQQAGCTIVFVTHGLNAVATFCTRAAWIDHGVLQQVGPATGVVNDYISKVNRDQQAAEAASHPERVAAAAEAGWRSGNRDVEIVDVQFLDSMGRRRSTFVTGESLTARIVYDAHGAVSQPVVGIALHASTGLHISGTNSR